MPRVRKGGRGNGKVCHLQSSIQDEMVGLNILEWDEINHMFRNDHRLGAGITAANRARSPTGNHTVFTMQCLRKENFMTCPWPGSVSQVTRMEFRR